MSIPIASLPLATVPTRADLLVGTVAATGAAANFRADGLGGAALGTFPVRQYGATGDGVTNDRAAIAAAITAAGAAGGGIVYFAPGTYYLATNLTGLPNNVQLRGADEHTTVLKPHAAHTGGTIQLLNNTGVRISHLRFDGSVGLNGSAVNMTTCTDCAIDHCTFDSRFAIVVLIGTSGSACVNCGIADCTLEGSTGEGIELIDTTTCYADRNVIASCAANGIVFFCRTAGYLLNNRAAGNAVTLCQNGISCDGGTRSRIANNHVSECTRFGINASDGLTGALHSTLGTLVGNTVEHCNTSDAGYGNIVLQGSHWAVTGNVSTNCAGVSGTGGAGFDIHGAYCAVSGNLSALNSTQGFLINGDYCALAGNSAIDNSALGVGSRDGIYLYGTYCVCVGNIATDTRGASVRMRFGIYADAHATRCTVFANRGAYGTATPWFNDASTGTIALGNGEGARPAVTGSRGGNAALASLLTTLATAGLITDSSS